MVFLISSFFIFIIFFIIFNININLKLIIFIIYYYFSAFIGDIIESYFKRKNNIKNSSEFIPGHGGVFDRFDSFLFSIIFYSIFINLFNYEYKYLWKYRCYRKKNFRIN